VKQFHPFRSDSAGGDFSDFFGEFLLIVAICLGAWLIVDAVIDSLPSHPTHTPAKDRAHATQLATTR
jgi:hypothetical protein